jgi:hypothetical protein
MGMHIRIGEIFRVPAQGAGNQFKTHRSYGELTRGRHLKSADINKGIWGYAAVEAANGNLRRPAVILLSNPLKEDSVDTPWVDVIDVDRGYALYNGDNHKAGADPLTSRGNQLLSGLGTLYVGDNTRKQAPPLLLFQQVAVGGVRKGYRRFMGYGVPKRFFLRTQRDKESDFCFTNLVVELALFRLERENELFDWNWIDSRRDAHITDDEALAKAPWAWQEWVKSGESALDRCTRRVLHRSIVRPRDQLRYSAEDRRILDDIVAYYCKKRHAFEALAARIAERVLGDRCTRSFVTRGSGDGGIDFVARHELGTDFSSTSVVVLGQAKCRDPQASVSPNDVARLVARLHRGWIGVFVTTATFSEQAQTEIKDDRCPVILVNGQRLVREVKQILNRDSIPLEKLLEREDQWYLQNLSAADPVTTFGYEWGVPMDITKSEDK